MGLAAKVGPQFCHSASDTDVFLQLALQSAPSNGFSPGAPAVHQREAVAKMINVRGDRRARPKRRLTRRER